MNAMASEVEERFTALDSLTLLQFQWLINQGVPSHAIVYPEMPAYADVVFHAGTPFFDFADDVDEEVEAIGAMIFVARQQFGEPCDLLAWSPRSGRIATWFGSDLPMLGWNNVFPPRLDLGDALTVHPTPLEWLKGGREGIVILKPKQARFYLEGFSLKVVDAVFGRRIRDALRWPEPRIFVESAGRAAA